MQRIISTLILLLFFALQPDPAVEARAWFFADDTLVSIDGTDYSSEDFKRWWKFWQDKDMALPETPDPYIEWLLLAREGRRMDLDSAPGFGHATRVFLQSRTLLKLKYDAVDSQIKVTDAEVRKRYEEQFVPRYILEGMEFKDEAAAKAAFQELTDGEVPVAELLGRDAEAGGPIKTAEMTFRANAVEKRWKGIYKDLAIGDVLSPEKLGQNKVLWYLKDVKGADDEDFASLRESISADLWEEQEGALTRKLIEDLRVKYEVKVDEERLAAIDLHADRETFTDAPVITTSQQNVSEKEFVAVVDRLTKSRPMVAGDLLDEERTEKLKKDTAYNVIAQSVTNWESLDRHYEEKEPFKWEYDFNYNHRLVTDVQQRLFAAQATVTDEEIKQQYEQNKKRYSVPARAKLYIVDATLGPIEQVWADVATGESFDAAVKKHLENYPRLQEVPVNHLDPEVKPVVEQLVEGETSQIFDAQGIKVLVHLSKRFPEAPIPFKRVQESIRQELYQRKLAQVEKSYLETLKSSSTIEVKQGQWKAIQKELGGAR